LRVISGKAGGLRLRSLSGLSTRPTADRIKESLFNIIDPVVKGAKVLDLFAGTGALGIEALSRGAEFAVFIDKTRESISIIKDNLKHTKLEHLAELYLTDFEAGLCKLSCLNKNYDIIFLDPPYGQGHELKAIKKIVEFQLLDKKGIIIVENEKKDELPSELYETIKVDSRDYGRTAVSFYKLKE